MFVPNNSLNTLIKIINCSKLTQMCNKWNNCYNPEYILVWIPNYLKKLMF